MTTATLIERLAALPSELRQAEATLLELSLEATERKRLLTECEDGLHLRGVIDGKNEAIRDAQLRHCTPAQSAAAAMADNCVKAASMQVRCLRDELAACRSIAKLLSGEEMER